MRTIVHLDADAFFASVEQSADARLRGKPIAVGGESRGIIASASYEARRFGIFTPMPTARARKLCPKLIVLPGDYERYEQFSNWMFGYAYDFTPNVEQTSIDEGYFDITANRSKPFVEIALTISKAIRQSLKITVSEGIGSNKLVSQIASKLNKPAAFQIVPTGQEKQFLHPLPNRWLPGIGPKTAVRLNAAGLADIGQVAATSVDLLALLLGNQAPVMRQFANGIDERPLIPASEPQKSFSQQETFNEDVTDEEYVEAVLRRMADKLFSKVREEGRSVRTLTVKVRYNDRDENQRAASLREPTDLETDIYGRLRGLLREAWQRRVSLRMVSLKLSNVYDDVFRSELPLETNARNHEARERLAVVMDELRRNKGWSAIMRGHDLRLRDAPRDIVNERNNPQLKIRVEIQKRSNPRHEIATYVPLRVRSHY
ncbi:MAG TPA: DNA polymerase IV, partial [Verrucomicrobiae bacterium]